MSVCNSNLSKLHPMLSVCHVYILKRHNLLSVCSVDMFNAMLSFVLNFSSCLAFSGCHVKTSCYYANSTCLVDPVYIDFHYV